jgi:hypothetical protein
MIASCGAGSSRSRFRFGVWSAILNGLCCGRESGYLTGIAVPGVAMSFNAE